jgi:hypothetical protein
MMEKKVIHETLFAAGQYQSWVEIVVVLDIE